MLEPVRVLYCTDTLMAGGVERQLTELVTRLDRTRFAPEIICLQGEFGGLSLHFAARLQESNIPLHIFNLGWNPLHIIQGIRRTIDTVWMIKPHILHAVNHHSNHTVRLARPFLPRSVRVITRVPTEFNTRQLLYERLSQWACDAIVCNSPYMREQIILKSHIPPQKVLYIPNGIDTNRFAQNPTPEFRTQIAPAANRILVMLGRISIQKSPQLLAQAIGLIKKCGQLPDDVMIFIVGERENNTIQAELENAIQQSHLEKIVIQYPQTTQPESFYHAADVVVLASLWEGMPNVVLESLAAGRPVIISEAANKANIIEQGKTGWIVRTGDVEHLAEILHDVLSLSPEKLNSMRSACRERVKDYAVPLMVERYTALYDRLRAIPKP